ncbi:OmpA family protein [Hyphomonas neptunium ATCC 15444]|uniref:OmpA family protein n=2 Tax=Hyphomonas TaxID=85 RepID=Q0BZE4_HYPNA|nr:MULTISPECIES: OmpA family protein [Hyphomonas]ABI77457.1 OmpA family protein [Hyphomonas neptunium ATCC 15444]
MKHTLKKSAGLAALSLSLSIGACSSVPDPSPRLLAAEASLQQAKADPATMETGRSAVEKADTALAEARDYYMRGKTDEYIHTVRMGEGYVMLAETRGLQREANTQIESLNTQRAEVVSQARMREVASAEAATTVAENRADRSDAVAAGAVADSAASETARLAAEARAAALTAELADYEQTKTDLGVTLILRDLQFASGSALLTSGAQGRLAPLASYLSKQPESRIQIAGHTDSQGAEAYNQDLSARRAASVGTYLASTGVDSGRINTIGLGESTPLSSNDTAAGRAINRRVEITILD